MCGLRLVWTKIPTWEKGLVQPHHILGSSTIELIHEVNHQFRCVRITT